jgi:hypothetical protein
MIELLQQPSTVVTGFAVLMLVGVLVHVRAVDLGQRKRMTQQAKAPTVATTPGENDPPLLPESRGLLPAQKGIAIGASLLAIVVGLVATMIDAGWFGRDEYKLVFFPAMCLCIGCGLAVVAALCSTKPAPMRGAVVMAIQVLLAVTAFGMIGCGGALVLDML